MTVTREVPTIEQFLPYIERALRAVHVRLNVGGEIYGEDVLFELGEDGAVTWTYTKAARIKWSRDQGKPRTDRQDSYLDLAGYAILEMARHAYANGDAIDGLFDRMEKRAVEGHEEYLKDSNLVSPLDEVIEELAYVPPDPEAGIEIALHAIVDDPPKIVPITNAWLKLGMPDDFQTSTSVEPPARVFAPEDPVGPDYSEDYWNKAKEEAQRAKEAADYPTNIHEEVEAEAREQEAEQTEEESRSLLEEQLNADAEDGYGFIAGTFVDEEHIADEINVVERVIDLVHHLRKRVRRYAHEFKNAD